MALTKNTGQSPSAAGTAISAASMALPDVPTLIVPGAGGALTIETSTVGPGTKEIRVTPAAGVACYWGWTGLAGGTNAWSFRGIWEAPSSLPSALTPIVNFRSSGGGATVATLAISSTNHFQVVADTAGTSVQSTNAIVAGTTYDVELRGENGTISTGVMTLTVRNMSNVEDTNLSCTHGGVLGSGTANFSTTVVAHVRIGKTQTAGNLGATSWKHVTMQTGSSAALPQPGTNLPPIVPPITNKIQTTGTTSFSAAASDPDGTVTGHSWVGTQPNGSSLSGLTGASTTTVTVPNQSTAGAYKLIYTATDDSGDSTATTTYEHVRPASGVAARPYLLISNTGTWTPGGAASSVLDGLAGDATKWILSPDGPAGSSVVVGMPAPALGHYDVEFYLDWVATDGSTSVAGVTGPTTCQVFQGTTPITSQAIFTRVITGQVLCQISFDAGEDTAMSADMTDIRIELTSSQV